MDQQVIRFWFEEILPAQWWDKDPAFDQQIRDRFGAVHRQGARCELYGWRTSPLGRLAEIIVLDQFSRNMFRNSPQAFAHDPLALALAQEAIASGADQELSQAERNFLYMPFMHSESLSIHEIAVRLFEKNGLESALEYELKHREIIERFGRYPHRNAILGRKSTTEELFFIRNKGSGF